MFRAIFSLLNASFAIMEAALLKIFVIIVIVTIILVVLATQKSEKRSAEGKMFCKKCGEKISEFAQVCPNCGAAVAPDNSINFCPNCGGRTPPGAAFCPQCGYSMNQRRPVQTYQQKSKIAAGLFGIFLGGLGIHNFYLGFKGKAIAQLLISILSFGLLAWISAIWGLIEGIMILVGSICYDADGMPLKD